jgi:imidazolonepropionase-like amidohydrolase
MSDKGNRPYILKGGTIVDGLGNDPFPGDVVVAGSRIEAITDDASSDFPDARCIDVTGRTLMPGLIDSHCHISFDEVNSNDELFFHRREGLSAIVAAANVQKVLAAGVTSIMDADSLFEIGVDLRDAIEAGIVPGPRMSVGGNALFTSVGGTAGRLVPDSGPIGYGKVVTSRDEIVQEVRRQIKTGVDWIKVHVTGLIPRQRQRGEMQVWSLDELRLVVDTAHELDIPVVGHCRGAGSIRDSARAGFDMILHATYMDDEALEAVIETKVPIVPTFTFQANLLEYGESIGASEDLREIFRAEIEESAEMLRKAYDHGVPLLCGTESGFSITPYGEWHYREMEVFVREMGLTPLQAIHAATGANASAMKMADEIGALQAGRLADLLVIDGDVSKDVTLLADKSRIETIILNGDEVNLPAPPLRSDPSGWRVSHYGSGILTQARAGTGISYGTGDE